MREKMRIARELALDLRQELGKKVIAIGLTGSVGRGTAQKYSDIDILILARKTPADSQSARIVSNTYCSLTFTTLQSALGELANANPHLPEILGGFSKIRPLYDPHRLFKKLERRAKHIPEQTFKNSAGLALLSSYEDFCRIKNAYLDGEDIVLRDNAINLTYSATLIMASKPDWFQE